MIRPVTCVCFLLACGSGLYLYQSKHRVQMLDREIEKTVRGTDELREQIRILHAEWTLQNDPQRLQALAEQFLNLRTVTPGQFTGMADLDSKLPAVRAPEPVAPPPMPMAQAPDTTRPEEPQSPPIATAPNPPPAPPAQKPVAVAVSSLPPKPQPPPEHKPASPAPPRLVVAEPVRAPAVVAEPARPAALAPRPVVATVAPRALAPAPAFVPPAGGSGSALGMARGASVPPPTPMPVSASQWVNNGGGGG